MSTVAMSGADTITINGRVLNDLATGTCVELTFANQIADLKTGKNGNTIYTLNTTGLQAEAKIHVIRGSSDDQFLLNLLVQQKNNFSGFVLMTGEFIKKLGDGQGNVASDTYVMGSGIFIKEVEAKTNVEGDVDQSTAVYSLKFSNAPRSIS